MPKQLRIKVPDVAAVLANGGLLSRADAVQLIADRLPSKGNSRRIRLDRVRKFLAYRINKGTLVPVRSHLLRLGDVARIAKQVWPRGHFDDLPQSVVAQPPAGAVGLTGRPSMAQVGYEHPSTLAECHRVIDELAAMVASIKKQNDVLARRVDDLHPDAEKWRRLRQHNKTSAQTSRNRQSK